MADDDLFAEMDLIADGLCAGSTFVDDLRFEFRQLQKCDCPDLTAEQSLAMFEHWRAHYHGRELAQKAAADGRAVKLLEERDGVLAQRAFLPPGPLRDAAEQRLWAIGNEIADLYQSRRPPPLAASWAADAGKST